MYFGQNSEEALQLMFDFMLYDLYDYVILSTQIYIIYLHMYVYMELVTI